MRISDWSSDVCSSDLLIAVAFTRLPVLLWVLEILPRLQLFWQVRDRQLSARLTPSYRVGCKRVLLSSEFYPAVCNATVELVTAHIARFDAAGVVTNDGRQERKTGGLGKGVAGR